MQILQSLKNAFKRIFSCKFCFDKAEIEPLQIEPLPELLPLIELAVGTAAGALLSPSSFSYFEKNEPIFF